MFPRTAIAKGVRVFLPMETAPRRAVEARLPAVFWRWGFQLGLPNRPAGTVLVHDVPTETRRTPSLDVFERAVAQGDDPWIT